MEKNFNVMDVVGTKEKTYVGVVDYSSTKHVIFFDFTVDKSVDVITAVIIWRSLFHNMRFSIFVNTHCPSLQIGLPILINKKDVVSGYDSSPLSRPKRKVLRKITI